MTELFFAYAGGSDSWQGFRSKLQIKTTYKICWYRSDPREVGAVYQGTQTRFLLLTHNVNYKLSLILRQWAQPTLLLPVVCSDRRCWCLAHPLHENCTRVKQTWVILYNRLVQCIDGTSSSRWIYRMKKTGLSTYWMKKEVHSRIVCKLVCVYACRYLFVKLFVSFIALSVF